MHLLEGKGTNSPLLRKDGERKRDCVVLFHLKGRKSKPPEKEKKKDGRFVAPPLPTLCRPREKKEKGLFRRLPLSDLLPLKKEENAGKRRRKRGKRLIPRQQGEKGRAEEKLNRRRAAPSIVLSLRKERKKKHFKKGSRKKV